MNTAYFALLAHKVLCHFNTTYVYNT